MLHFYFFLACSVVGLANENEGYTSSVKKKVDGIPFLLYRQLCLILEVLFIG
jgi:hypothetical protein